MKIKQEDILINDLQPFENCKLDRQKNAENLTNIISTYSSGFVLAINNEWGTGKTTFVKMWCKSLQNDGYRTLYFNAWENDFQNNPLVALMAELKTLITDKNNKALFQSLLKKGAVITKNVLPGLLKAIAAKYIDKEIITESIEKFGDAATEILEDEIKEYTSKKEGLVEFKKKLEEFIEKVNRGKPIVFIIDELDRCRPNYSVEVLEQVKHFFSVKGIVFILSIDKEQLGNAIRGVYGSDRINSDEYLRRFIDLEYTMEPPKPEVFCRYLFSYFEFDKFFQNEKRKNIQQFKNDEETFIKISSMIFKYSNLSLRQQEKLFAHTSIVLNSFNFNSYIFPGLLFILIYIRTFHKELYLNIKYKRSDTQNLLDEFEKALPKKLNEDEIDYFTYLEANLVYMYTNSLNSFARIELLSKDESNEEICLIKSRINKSDNRTFTRQLKGFIENWDLSSTKIEYLISKIDFTEFIE